MEKGGSVVLHSNLRIQSSIPRRWTPFSRSGHPIPPRGCAARRKICRTIPRASPLVDHFRLGTFQNDKRHMLVNKAIHKSRNALSDYSSCGSREASTSGGEMRTNELLVDCGTDKEECVLGGIVALGKFDALHIGHRELAIEASKAGTPFLLSFVRMAELLGWEYSNRVSPNQKNPLKFMATFISSSPCLSFIIFLSMIFMAKYSITAANSDRKVYIAYMGEKPSLETSAQSLHFNLLNHVLDGINARESIVHSYGRSFNGFAAKLTEKEKQRLEDMEGIVSVFPSKTLHVQTTRSWDFLGVTETMELGKTLKSDVIVGMIDTGIWPESESFSDEGFGPPPKKWKGSCSKNFTCNNKIIGAKYYASEGTIVDEPSPRDTEGHGSHTASTVAGVTVSNVSFSGIAKGNARGGMPGARLAIYKVCWPDHGCSEVDVLAAFDDAIADGVDIISISLGGLVRDYFSDSIAIGSFHAMKKAIATSAAAGNGGPLRETLSNMAPWMISVAASSIDRRIIDKVVVGNNKSFVGVSVNPFSSTRLLPFISSPSCSSSDLPKAKGSILLCMGDDGGVSAHFLHAAGLVSIDSFYIDFGRQYSLPALDVMPEVGLELNNYINSTRNPVAKILKSEGIFDPKAPIIVSFSSRGPSAITPDILKPDISAPGVNIIAAWSPKGKLTSDSDDKRSVTYNIISGTSMACPHVTGTAAYIKSFHPSWSPAAILSALVTTATPMNPSYHPDAELDHGAGQLNPVNAAKPGLIYDASVADFIQMLCNMGYDTTKLRIITGDKSTCNSSKTKKGSVRDLNYPSLALNAQKGIPVHASFPRTVTNVGFAKSVYKAKIITSNSKFKVTVKPQVLKFEALKQKLEFVVTVSGPAMDLGSVASASLVWFDGKHNVRSPIVVFV